MNEDRFNMSIRKFLKAVGVTSQREIETLKAKVTLTLSGVDLAHEIDGEIELG